MDFGIEVAVHSLLHFNQFQLNTSSTFLILKFMAIWIELAIDFMAVVS